MADLLDRGVPDEVDTSALPTVPAAEIDHLAGRWERWVAPREDVPPAVRARALLSAGRVDGARSALGAAVAGPVTPQGVAAAVWTAARVGSPDHLEALAAQVAGLPRPFVTDGDVPITPTAVLDGLLAAARGDLDASAALLRDGVADGDRRAPVWGALARLELARVLAAERDDLVAAGGDPAAAEPERGAALAAALVCFTAAGHRHLRACAEDLARGGPGSPWPERLNGDVATPGRGVLVPGPEWRVGFGVQPSVPVGASLGLVVLHHLLVHRGRRVSVVELDRVASGGDPRPQLAADLAAAAAVAGGPDAATLGEELLDERARSRVSKLVRRTVDRLEDLHPSAGRHLRAHLSTGWACSYDAPDHVRWVLAD